MKKEPLATIINFCTNESRFIRASIEEAKKFSSQIIVAVCDHFFDKTIEDLSLLQKIYASFKGVEFIQYPMINLPEKIAQKIDPAHFWHSASRWVGFSFLKKEIQSVLFLDADEVADGISVQRFLSEDEFGDCHALKFANYWYFRSAENQAKEFEDSIVLAKKEGLNRKVILHMDERDAIYNSAANPKKRRVLGKDQKPMFHHFSWVRTKEEMLKKVAAWGHSKDRDWSSLVAEEFSRPFQGRDFVHGYSYQNVKPLYNFSFEAPEFLGNFEPNVKMLSEKEFLSLIEPKRFWIF